MKKHFVLALLSSVLVACAGNSPSSSNSLSSDPSKSPAPASITPGSVANQQAAIATDHALNGNGFRLLIDDQTVQVKALARTEGRAGGSSIVSETPGFSDSLAKEYDGVYSIYFSFGTENEAIRKSIKDKSIAAQGGLKQSDIEYVTLKVQRLVEPANPAQGLTLPLGESAELTLKKGGKLTLDGGNNQLKGSFEGEVDLQVISKEGNQPKLEKVKKKLRLEYQLPYPSLIFN